MRAMSRTYGALLHGTLCMLAGTGLAEAQVTAADANRTTCAALLANDSSAGARIGPADSVNRARDTSARARTDTASFGIGGARTGPGDIILLVGVYADEVRFASQPHVRVRLCWGRDTLRVVQRENLPSPVVAGTTYRNVYVAVELIGRINAACLADRIGVGTPPQGAQRTNPPAPRAAGAPSSVSNCAFLGGTAGAGAANPRPPSP